MKNKYRRGYRSINTKRESSTTNIIHTALIIFMLTALALVIWFMVPDPYHGELPASVYTGQSPEWSFSEIIEKKLQKKTVKQ